MNIYYYWYFIIHSLYYSYSKDYYFDVMAIGLFSVLISFIFLGIVTFIAVIFGIQDLLFKSPYFIMGGAGVIQIINYIIFAPKKRQERLNTLYKRNQSTTKDIISITLTIISILSLIISAIFLRNTI